MTRRRVLLDIALGLLGCFFAAALTRELLAAHPLPAPPAPRAARPVAAPADTASAPAPPSYGVITAKNLFSPSRSEGAAGPVAAVGPKPLLHGVVIDGTKSRAYLEDPQLKRTFGYAVGDTVGGGRLESISVDRVVIGRADGLLEVLLKDPSKPKAPAPATPSPTAVAAPAKEAPRPAASRQPAAGTRSPDAPVPVAAPSRVLAPGSRATPR